jgi:hypothetical protein
MMQAMQTCRELTMQVAVIGNPQLATECQGFEETSSWAFHDSLEAAKAHLGATAIRPGRAGRSSSWRGHFGDCQRRIAFDGAPIAGQGSALECRPLGTPIGSLPSWRWR